MRKQFSDELEEGRLLNGPSASCRGNRHGFFHVKTYTKGFCDFLQVLIGTGRGWESARISHRKRYPGLEEVWHVKRLVWRDDETVMQIYPPEQVRLSAHGYVVQLWRPLRQTMPIPPELRP